LRNGVEDGITIEENPKVVPLQSKPVPTPFTPRPMPPFLLLPSTLPDTPAIWCPAEEVKKVTNVPVIAVGRLDHEPGRALQEGKADLIAIGRRLTADPDLPNKVSEGRTEEIIPCIGCFECIERMGRRDEGVICTINPINRGRRGAPDSTAGKGKKSWSSAAVRQGWKPPEWRTKRPPGYPD